eukprot:Plantae.Rhodophyta-Palmaria_palmata.ctg15033.p1 GENE.Plantae.Rhodophyta-Palmaria_palmata.ctg15033~~Plantae.Rhodophyta-Palmaria_palmata.ctg15033.p1  ORF type:complete len:143 (-),score=25.37 Plantae.Rhodophyta-Palmaria_palmata.ctg15033:295-723(-)
MARQEAIVTLGREQDDIQKSLVCHFEEARQATKFHKRSTSDAYKNYKDITTKLEQIHVDEDVSEADIENFIDAASDYDFQMSSDYQQDKLLPSWNESPQPGQTYYMSGVTQYVHIFCMESCGLSSNDTELSRNLVFVRDERV